DRDDLRGKGNLVALETVRVTGSVVVLVMRKHDRPDSFEVRDLPDEIRSDDGVRLHLGPLFVGERGGLPQNVLGDADLSDVVEKRAEIDRGDLVRPEAERLRDGERVLHAGGGA